MLTVMRLGLPLSLRRSLACTNIIENMMGTIRRVCVTSNAGAMRRWHRAGSQPRLQEATNRTCFMMYIDDVY
jgi:hypothetical protein